MESPLRAVWKFCHSGAAAAIIIGAAYSVFSGLGQLGASLVVFVVGLVASVAVVVGAERLRARAGAAASAESFGTRSQCQPFSVGGRRHFQAPVSPFLADPDGPY